MRRDKDFILLTIVCSVFALILCASGAVAQTGATTVGSGIAGQSEVALESGILWADVIQSGGVPIIFLALMSVFMVALIIYFLVVLRAGQIVPAPLYREVVDKINAGMLDEAVNACEYQPCAFSAVALTAIERVKNDPRIDYSVVKDLVESEGERQAEDIQGQTQYLLDIGVIAPMVGLLGTVLGMLQAFSGVALSSALSKPVVLAGGVSKALITTAAGLLVAIPAMIAYSLFRRNATKLVTRLESTTTEVLTALMRDRK